MTLVGAVIPATGRYAVQGAQLRAGLELWARRARVELRLEDDRSRPAGSVRAYRGLVRRGCDLVLGPYGSDSTRAVAIAGGGSLVWNHGAAADDVQRLPGVVSVASPASGYLVALGRGVAALRPGASVALVTGSGRFAAFARDGLERHVSGLGLAIVARFSLRADPVDVAAVGADAVLLCGPLAGELAMLRALVTLVPRAVLGGVSPGPADFARLLGHDPEGILAPVQSRPTWNVVAVAGDAAAQRAAVVVAHHDAAHTSLLFSPAPSAFVGERFPALLERTDTTPPLMWPVIGGPLLVAAGALLGARGVRTAGAVLALGAAASFAEIGLGGVVPGVNDNLSGVATLIGLARRLADQPVDGLRVLLVSTGSEESFMEGMQAFGRRHFASLPADRTHVICVDTVGSPELVMLEGEGMLWMNDYPKGFKDFVAECARRAGLHLRRGLRFRNATDALIALRAGYPTVMLGSVNRYKLPDNYHWRTDVPDNVDFATTSDAVALCDQVIRKLAVRRVDFATHRN